MSRRLLLVVPVIALVAAVGLAIFLLHGHASAARTRQAASERPSTPAAAPAGEVTVVGVGDSVMAGSHCECSGVTAQFATAWGDRLDRTVHSVNLGVPGDTTTTLRQRLDTDADTRADLRHARPWCW